MPTIVLFLANGLDFITGKASLLREDNVTDGMRYCSNLTDKALGMWRKFNIYLHFPVETWKLDSIFIQKEVIHSFENVGVTSFSSAFLMKMYNFHLENKRSLQRIFLR